MSSKFTSRDALFALVALGLLCLGCLALGNEQLATGFAFSASTVAMAAVGQRDTPPPAPPRARTRTPPGGVPRHPTPVPTEPHVPTFPLRPEDDGNT